jgi:2-keto-4-pentenoate hydratase/2-oxohepta-3-ene-1,7-dioic acid hydratase in catechol pathway
MKLATIQRNGEPCVALRMGDESLIELSQAYRLANQSDPPRSVLQIIEQGLLPAVRTAFAAASAQAGQIPLIKLSDVEWLPPVTRPSKILGVAFNNNELTKIAHVLPKAPMYFLKPPSALTGHNKPIVLQQNYGYTIPELEVAAVIGKRCSHISADQALQHVFGYSIIDDVTSSGLKFSLDSIAIDMNPERVRPHHVAWRRRRGPDDNELYFTYHTRSKGSDTFGPMGPWLTTADEIPNPNQLEVKGWVNGELFAVDSTANYNFTIENVIADASQYFTLEPGDIIHFGTSGRGHGRFKAGHLSVNLYEEDGPIEIEISGLGRLSNPIVHTWKS